jgi:hypothetical protein
MDRLSRSVRPVLTLSFAATLIYLALSGNISTDFIQGLFAGVIQYWFAEGAANTIPGQGQQKG